MTHNYHVIRFVSLLMICFGVSLSAQRRMRLQRIGQTEDRPAVARLFMAVAILGGVGLFYTAITTR